MPPQISDEMRVEIATPRKDITNFYYTDRLAPQDATLVRRGEGGTSRVYDVYLDIIRDCHAYTVLQKRYLEIISREWEVVPASKSATDQKAADLCRDILNNLASRPMQRDDATETEMSIAGGFDQTCLDLLPAILNGFAVSEVIWDQQGKEVRPVEVIQKDVRRFVFNVGDRGYRLRLLTYADLFYGEPIPPKKMIVHRFSSGGMSSDPYGLGLGTRLFYPVFFKRNCVKFWLVFADKYGSPTAILKHPKNASAQDKQSYKKALQAIAQDAGILLPEGVDVDFLEAARSSSINCYKDLVDFCNGEMSKTVLGETGSTDQTGPGGSRARDEVGNSVRIAIAKADSDLLSDTLNRTLLTWITRLNYGDAANPPKVWRKFPELEEKEDLNSRIGRDKQLFDLGFRITKDKVEQVYGDGYETSEGADQKPPLVTRLGVSGTASFMQFLGQIGSGSIPRENAVAALAIVFGMSAEEADKIVPKDEAIAQAQKSNPETAPDLAGIIGGDQPADAPTDQPPPETPPTEAPPTVQLTEESVNPVMIGFWLPSDVAQAIAVENGEPPDQLHLTLGYFGKLEEIPAFERLDYLLAQLCQQVPPINAVIGGVGRFNASESSDNKDVVYASVDAPGLVELRQQVIALFEQETGIAAFNNHGFTPHITLAYVNPGAKFEATLPTTDVKFDRLVLAVGGVHHVYPLAKESADLSEVNELPDPAELFTAKARKSVQAAVSGWVDSVGAIVEGAESFEEIQAKLKALYPDLNPSAFSGAIADAMVATNLAGRWEVLQEGATTESFAESPEYQEAIAVLNLCDRANSLDDIFGADAANFSEMFSDLLEELL